MGRRHRLVVKRQHPRRRWLFAGIAVVIALALVAAVLLGERWGGYNQFTHHTELAKTSRALAAQSAQNAALKARVAFLEHSLKLANGSAAALKKNLSTQQGDLVKLKQNLAFYQGLMQAPGAGDAKVRIGGLQLLATNRAHEYRFQIVLVRADGKTSPALKGSCEVTVSGMRGGKKVRLPLKSISPHSTDPLRFTLIYFTNISGALDIPAGFSPREVEVSVQMHGDPTVTGTYSWPVFRS